MTCLLVSVATLGNSSSFWSKTNNFLDHHTSLHAGLHSLNDGMIAFDILMMKMCLAHDVSSGGQLELPKNIDNE